MTLNPVKRWPCFEQLGLGLLCDGTLIRRTKQVFSHAYARSPRSSLHQSRKIISLRDSLSREMKVFENERSSVLALDS